MAFGVSVRRPAQDDPMAEAEKFREAMPGSKLRELVGSDDEREAVAILSSHL
jgi:hypothetical protein